MPGTLLRTTASLAHPAPMIAGAAAIVRTICYGVSAAVTHIDLHAYLDHQFTHLLLAATCFLSAAALDFITSRAPVAERRRRTSPEVSK